MTEITVNACEAKRRELSDRIAAVAEELAQIDEELQKANVDHGAKTRGFFDARAHVGSVWRLCNYALQSLEGR